MNGNVTPSFDGLISLADTFTSTTYTALADAISEAVANMQTAGFQPDVVVLSPSDWLAVQVLTASGSGEYLSGSYLGALPQALRGLRVVLSPTVTTGLSPAPTTGRALLMDSAHIDLRVVEDFSVEVGYVNTDFTNNVVTLLGELRVIPVFRCEGAAVLVAPRP